MDVYYFSTLYFTWPFPCRGRSGMETFGVAVAAGNWSLHKLAYRPVRELQAGMAGEHVPQHLFSRYFRVCVNRVRYRGDNLPHCRLRYYLCRPCADQDREENNRY